MTIFATRVKISQRNPVSGRSPIKTHAGTRSFANAIAWFSIVLKLLTVIKLKMLFWSNL
ncbi:MAG: hypothetical protein GDA56_25260 [Hormoscilla sp. GM7CHS1pb]|nr:hypothetical protein [Hormoscilla sp. GM7CHS1pb]